MPSQSLSPGKEIYKQVQSSEPDTITCEELPNDPVIFDARTKKEFDAFHIPNAIHIPLVSNEEFHNVGLLYKQVSPETAYDLGFDYIYKNTKQILENATPYKDKDIIVTCSRGGLRSKTLIYLLKSNGFSVKQLVGGMKAYRNFVHKELETIPLPNLIILQGLAGSRKTTLLQNLKNKIDLEGCAKHCSSAFGSLDHKPNSQKQFLFELHYQLKKINANKQHSHIFIEGEGRKVGPVIIPKRLWEKMNSSPTIFLDVSLDNRAEHLAKVYPCMKKYLKDYIEQTNSLKKLISKKLKQELIELIINNNSVAFWKLILKEHYDPKYNHAFKSQSFQKTIDANDFEKTLRSLEKYSLT